MEIPARPGSKWQLIDSESSPEPKPLTPLTICGPDGTGEPVFTSTKVAFNGDFNAEDGGEPFRLTLHDLESPGSCVCKTLQNPYDLLVICAMVRFAHHFPLACVDSDGGKHTIERAIRICQQLFGEAAIPRACYSPDSDSYCL